MTKVWSAKTAFAKVLNRTSQSDFRVPSEYSVRPGEVSDVTVDVLEESLVKAALLVDRYGDEYLDYFLRIQSELEIRKTKEIALNEAKQLASQACTSLDQSDFVQP